MELNQAKLSRLQLFGTLAIVFMLALTLSSYFLLTSWNDFQARQHTIRQDAYARARDYLRSYADHAAQTLSALRERTNDTLKQRLREQVDQAWTLADAIWRQERLRRPPRQVQRLIVEALRPLRYFDGRGYFFIDGLDGSCVLLPTAPQLEGGSLLANRDDQGRYIMRALIESVANEQRRGFSSYRWYQPGSGEMSEKVAYARRFQPYDWLIGSGEYLNNVEADMQKQGLEMLARMRFGHDSGDFMIIDHRGVILLDPANPTMNGKHYSTLPGADRGRIAELMRRGKQGGFMEYLISSLDAPQGERYLSYARQLPGWDWTLVASLHVQSIEDSSQRARQELERSLRERIAATLLLTLVALLSAGGFCWCFLRWLNVLVQRYRQDLEQSHHSLEQRSRDLRLSHFMVDNATDLIALRDAGGAIVYCNQAARQRLDCGCDAEELTRALFRLPAGELPRTFETKLQCCGETQYLEVTVNQLGYQGEDYLCATGRDITARRQTDRQLRLAAKAFESSNEAILVTDPDNRILAVNRAFCAITGYEEAEALGQTPALLASGRHDPAFFENMWQQLRQRGQWSGEIWNRRKNGDIFPEWLNISVLLNEQGEISHYVALFTDISERKEQEARVQHLAEYDALTDLPNRVLINDRLQQAIRQAELRQGQLAVLFVDLDHFKNINDTLGHSLGDELLKQAASRLGAAVGALDTVGRTGGDEFVLILPAIDQPGEAAQVAERVLAAMQQPFELGSHQLSVSCSIGISLMPDDGRDIQNLLMNADLAMYHAKAHGRSTFRFYTREMNVEVAERLHLETRLRRAIEHGELYLVYQPQFNMSGERLLGCEALVRWRDPEHGLIMPSRFIPIAEDTGLVVPLGRWVLREACRQAAQWYESGLRPVRMAVNVSARQLTRPDFVDDVRDALQASGLPGYCLEVEVTESTLMEDADFAARQLAVIKAMGVRLSIDDFGTGYSSLAYLKRFAPDTIKIDRSFIIDLPQDEENAAIVSAIVHLANALGMDTLAEGVEHPQQQAYLGKLGCSAMQGYLLGAPLSAEAMEQRMDTLRQRLSV